MLIRGPSGSGKSQLAFDLLCSDLPFTRLVADDRVELDARAGRLLVRPAAALAGMLEIRGLGIRRFAYESVAVVGVVIDLAATDALRYPGKEAEKATIHAVSLPRLAVAPGMSALGLVLAFQHSAPSGD